MTSTECCIHHMKCVNVYEIGEMLRILLLSPDGPHAFCQQGWM